MAIVIAITGVIGGAVACSRGPSTNTTRSEPGKGWIHRLAVSTLESVAAAAIVPLFLSTIGSDDIKTLLGNLWIDDPVYRLAFVRFVGFCLVAALGARRFIDSASARVFKLEGQVKDVQATSAQNQAKITQIADTVLEDDAVTARPTTTAGETPKAAAPLDPSTVLEAFANGNIPARSIQGLAVSLARSTEDIKSALQTLQQRELVRAVETFRGERWILTALGSEALQRA